MLKVLQAGTVLVQDSGRSGYEHVGVPVSGAFDYLRFEEANLLVDNDVDNAAFELYGGRLEFFSEQDTLIAAVGEGLEVVVDGLLAAANAPVFVERFSFCRITKTAGSVAYVAVSGLSPKRVLGSASTDTFSKLGPAAVSVGDTFEMNYRQVDGASPKFLWQDLTPHSSYCSIHYFPVSMEDGKDNLEDGTYTVETVSRSGVKLLAGDVSMEHANASMPSIPVFPGIIQLPPNGQPIILGPDAGTVGGYPVIGVVYSSEMYKLARIVEGDVITLVSKEPTAVVSRLVEI